MRKNLYILITMIFVGIIPSKVFARSTENMTIGLYGMGNIQLVPTTPEIDPGPGGGVYFDYRFNQRFSITVDAWCTTHGGTGTSSGDSGIEFLGIPTFTIKLYFMDDETSRWDPYAGLGIGMYAVSEGSRSDGTNGVGLGAQMEVGFDYYFSNIFSAGFAGVFRSTALINSLSGGANEAFGFIPYTLIGKFGFHF